MALELYKNINKEILAIYDENFKANYFFEDEIDNTYKKLKKKRYFLTSDSIKNIMFLNELPITLTKDGLCINFLELEIYLIKLSETVYLLEKTNKLNASLKAILYTFMKNNNCLIDVTKFAFFFKDETNTIDLYRM